MRWGSLLDADQGSRLDAALQVRPALALQILRERLADSPLPRWPAMPHAFASASTR